MNRSATAPIVPLPARVVRRVAIAAVAFASVLAIADAAHAVAYVWNNAAGGNWSTPTNWTPNGVPNTDNDSATIDAAGTYTVTVDGAFGVRTLSVGGASGTQTLSVPSGRSLVLRSFVGPASVTVNANAVLDLGGGAITAGGNTTHAVTINGRMDWSAGSMNVVFQPFVVGPTATLNISGAGAKSAAGGAGGETLQLQGTTTWSGNGTVTLNNGIVTTHSGTMLVTGDPVLSTNSNFTNSGTITKNGSAGTFTIQQSNNAWANTGRFEAVTGTIQLDLVGGTWTTSGPNNAFDAAAGAAIAFRPPNGGLMTYAATQFTGPGTKTLTGAGGAHRFNGTIAATNLVLAAGLLQFGSPTTLVGTLEWTGGDIGTGGFGLTIPNGSTLNVTGPVAKRFRCCQGNDVLTNAGTVNLASNIAADTFFAINNQAGGVFNVNTTATMPLVNATFTNAGTLRIAQGASAQFVVSGGGVTFNNTGSVLLNGAALVFGSGGNTYAQSGAGATQLGTLPSGALQLPVADAVNLSGGILGGIGTVSGRTNVTGTAVVAPGNSTGIVNVAGAYIQGGGTLSMELNGTSPGTSLDQLAVTGTVTLGGALAVTLGFAPPLNTVFLIIDNDGSDAVTGTFTGLAEGATLVAGGHTLRVSYVGGTGNDVTLTVTALPAAATTTALVSSLNPSTSGQAVTFTATVAGTNPTGTIQFRDGATNLGAPVALVAGQAQLVTSVLAIGAHPITAVYSGDPGNQPSTSPVVNQVVNAPATGTLDIAPLTLAVGEGGSTATLTVTRSGGSFGAASVAYATVAGTATAGSDFVATSGTLNWVDGDATPRTIVVTILNDAVAEGSEQFAVTLSNATGATLGGATATVTILDDDSVLPPPSDIPTLSEWMLMLASVLLGATGWLALRRRY
jgi:hypothetical protein